MSEISPSFSQLLPGLVDRQPIARQAPIGAGAKIGSEGAGVGKSFSDTLTDILKETNSLQLKADGAAKDFAAGRSKDIHDVMIAMEKAEIALRQVTAVRNKLIEAYQEMMRMPV